MKILDIISEEKKKNCGCGKDPCETYGKQQESKDEYKPHMMYKGSKKDYRAKYPTKKKHHDSLMSRGYNHDDPETKKKEEDIAPKGPEVTIGDYTTTHFFMCGSAIKAMKKHANKDGAEELTRMQDNFYKMEKQFLNKEQEDLPFKVYENRKGYNTNVKSWTDENVMNTFKGKIGVFEISKNTFWKLSCKKLDQYLNGYLPNDSPYIAKPPSFFVSSLIFKRPSLKFFRSNGNLIKYPYEPASFNVLFSS